jgi:hypothetical protein
MKKSSGTAVKNTGNHAPSTKGFGAPVKKNAATPPTTPPTYKKGGAMKGKKC